MIAQQSRTWYGCNPIVEIAHFTVCALCEAHGPDAPDDQSALDLAIAASWKVKRVQIGYGFITVHYCPDCVSKRKA